MNNKYYDEIIALGQPLTAENLLTLMRRDVEPVLNRLLFQDRTPSQSLRVNRALDILKTSPRPEIGDRDAHRQRREDKWLLEDFLAVHRTCYLLEGRTP